MVKLIVIVIANMRCNAMLRQQLDLHSLIHHSVPSCKSKQEHKNLVGGAAECIFKGVIKVDAEAQQTESSQLVRSLLLTKKSKVKARQEKGMSSNHLNLYISYIYICMYYIYMNLELRNVTPGHAFSPDSGGWGDLLTWCCLNAAGCWWGEPS